MATISELRTKFSGMSTEQKRKFCVNLKKQLEDSNNNEHKRFLNECIRIYNEEVKGPKSAVGDAEASGGNGARSDIKAQADKWLQKAAEGGDKEAMFHFALQNETNAFPGADINVAVEYYEKLVELAEASPDEIDVSNTDAMFNLGYLYCEGRLVGRDAERGKALIEACLAHCNEVYGKIDLQPYDCYRVGVLYCTGDINPDNEPGVSDFETGVKLLDIAINDGLAGFNPENIVLAKRLRENALKRRESTIELDKGLKELAEMGAQITSDIDSEKLATAKKFLTACEEAYFTGPFSEGVISADLEGRRNLDMLGLLGSGGPTNNLSEKKRFYMDDFEQAEAGINLVMIELKKSNAGQDLVTRCGKCKKQLNKLRDLVKSIN